MGIILKKEKFDRLKQSMEQGLEHSKMSPLDKLKRIVERATPGPWKWVDVNNGEYSALTGPLEDPKFPSIDPNAVMSDGSACGEYESQIDGTTHNGIYVETFDPSNDVECFIHGSK